jgi:hypothetical protein
MFFSWIAIARLDADSYQHIVKSDYVEVAENPGFLKLLGFKTARAYRPWLVSPRIDVWQEIERRIHRELKGAARGRSSVLKILEASELAEKTFTFTIRFYRPNILAIEIHLKTEIEASIHDAFRLGQLEAHPAALAAVDSLVGIIRSGSTRGYPRNNQFFARSAILAPIGLNEVDFKKWEVDNRGVIANLSINNSSYAVADKALADAIFSRNKDANIKFSGAGFSLVSKQGILTVYSDMDNAFRRHLVNEHSRRIRFLELGLALREFLLEFTACRQQNEDVADFLFYLSRPLITDTPNIMTTATGAYVWKILAEELGFNNFMNFMDSHLRDQLEKKTPNMLKIQEIDYHALDFDKKVSAALRSFHRNWLEKAYDRHKVLFWILGAVITVVAALLKIVVK